MSINTLLVFSFFLIMFSVPSATFAQGTVPAQLQTINVGALPDSLFYGFKVFGENLQIFFTFDDVSRAQLENKISEERLIEAQQMADAGKSDLAAQSLADYDSLKDSVESDKEQADLNGNDISQVEQTQKADADAQNQVLNQIAGETSQNNQAGTDENTAMINEEVQSNIQENQNIVSGSDDAATQADIFVSIPDTQTTEVDTGLVNGDTSVVVSDNQASQVTDSGTVTSDNSASVDSTATTDSSGGTGGE